MKSRRAILLLVTLLTAGSFISATAPAWADDDGDGGKGNDGGGESKNGSGSGIDGSSTNSLGSSYKDRDDDSARIQNAVKQGHAVSLNTLLNHIKSNYDGTVINVELEKHGPNYIYQVKLLTSDNKLRILNLDAMNLTMSETLSLY